VLKKIDADYDPTDRARASEYLERHRKSGQVVTGLLYLEEDGRDLHAFNHSISGSLVTAPKRDDRKQILEKVQARYW
jgi:2-oxoglutarate/2-oxoacid ferredoxin oxidoreductase subunit beta